MAELIDFKHLDMLRDVIGDDLKEILEVFITTAPNDLIGMQQTLSSQDAEGLRLHAHTMKGSAANVGATTLSLLAKNIEEMAKSGELPVEGKELNELEDTLNKVISALQDYIKNI
ncbi:Hpt domain-containing protein [Hydrogenovibrio kuenenii]|uniref:Hpt domain-containing protein n=1 Tax=Hydrogenovibrio kuenenii TaxID=63658 RepID=UPI000465C1FB|nr:Hpt domain-containing protein [Hydrogenovibrio kuenenii]